MNKLVQTFDKILIQRDSFTCVSKSISKLGEAAERLSIIRDSNDGFFIASEDLRLRGPGDLLGVRQSGDMGFGVADIYRDHELLAPARDSAEQIISGSIPISEDIRKALDERLSRSMENSYYV